MNTPSPGYRKLCDLCMGGMAADVENVYQAAMLRIQALESKLNRQSTMLAEALKAKNDWLLRFQAQQSIINKLEADLKACKDMAEAEVLKYLKENNQLREELARLRPPEPKFRVKQIVVCLKSQNAFTIRHKRRNCWSGCWEYSNSRLEPTDFQAWTEETYLRALTDEEK